MLSTISLYMLSPVLVVCSCQVILATNTVYSALFLILSFVCSSIILLILESEFFALLFIIVYVGAVAVLLLFIIMMLDNKVLNFNNNVKYFPFTFFICVILFFEIFLIIYESPIFTSNPYCIENSFELSVEYSNFYQHWWYKKIDSLTEASVIGQILYNYYTMEFLLAGLILFLAVLGSVVITLELIRGRSLNQDGNKQVSGTTLG